MKVPIPKHILNNYNSSVNKRIRSNRSYTDDGSDSGVTRMGYGAPEKTEESWTMTGSEPLTFAAQLAYLLREKDLTLKRAAEIAGVSRTTMWRWLKGQRYGVPTAELAIPALRALKAWRTT